ncbi:DUF3616 domain-containing protein [Lutibaculum baratangense]|uniref:DUF3616 domain-containing protein n=1 Tax=Lutibaculum baratangense AMV1 TaxID=631454 RepID=V4R8D4_9HYPH|nr:DUF3616 domain-containing protein [Lutibaculum baratangense]ESR22426.1 hypothetical protein N177_4156 [Lutibaculum baratangense AMV1]
MNDAGADTPGGRDNETTVPAETAVARRQVKLELASKEHLRHVDDPLHEDISAVAKAGNSLFLACDETATVERVVRLDDDRFGNHRSFSLGDIFDLPAGPEGEMDIEGLATDSGYLWIVGSHSLKRTKPKREKKDASDALDRMTEIEREPNRYFLGRVPLLEESPGLYAPVREAGGRRAASLKLSRRKSILIEWLHDDPHLAPFFDIPSKENGFDIEGIAVKENRVWLGLRGPVFRGHGVILELELKEKSEGVLKARRIDGERRYRKHFFDTRGLGIRDLRRDGQDMLMLIGPTMALDGHCHVLRWLDATAHATSGVVHADRVEDLFELEYGLDRDHPEGIETWREGGRTMLLVVHDAPAEHRLDKGDFALWADLVDVPPRPRG